MTNRSIIKSSSGLAGVIEALLLVAMVSIIISMIQLVYIPEIMEQREAEHMDAVENQFSFLKSTIDLQTALGKNMPQSSPITLGSRELPYLVTARAFGQLDIVDAHRTDSVLRVNPNLVGTGQFNGQFSVPLTSFIYEAYNSYFVHQIYVLEGGAVMMVQPDGETSKVEPSITVKNESECIVISYNLPILKSISGKNATAGIKNCFVRTNRSHNETYTCDLTNPTTNYIRFSSDYLDAWNQTLCGLLEEEIKNGYVTIKIESEPYPCVEIRKRIPEPPKDDKDIRLNLEVVYIGAQIGPGIVTS
jgi:hypothetical protein